MSKYDPDRNISKIDLTQKRPTQKKPTIRNPASTVVDMNAMPLPSPGAGMSVLELENNYATIMRAGAIHYPVAYQFLKELGRGRQGRVFLGLRQGARGCITEHAIKVFDPEIYRSPEEYWTDMGRIAAQISQLQRVQSPNLVSRHSYEETYGIGYVQMESIDGLDLSRLLTKKHLATARERSSEEEWQRFTRTIFRVQDDTMYLQPGAVVYILRGVLRGLERLHAMDFLHSDIKPANVMIDRLGGVKVIDFGRAVIVGERVTFLLGSPLYMAPETHRRQIGGVESDVYSVGLLAVEMLLGKRIANVTNVTEDDLVQLKMELPQRLPDLLPPHVLEDEPLVSVLLRLIEPDPAKRKVTAKEAEAGDDGLRAVDKQYAQAGMHHDYARDFADYLAKLVDVKTSRIEMQYEKLDVSSVVVQQ